MEITLAAQTVVFLRAILLGVLCGAVYDVCRAVRRAARAGPVLTALLDGLFWLAALILLFAFSVVYAAGQARGYVLAGEGLGLMLYGMSFSPLVLPLLTGLLRFAARGLRLPGRAARRARRLLRRCGQRIRLNRKKIKKNFKKNTSFFRHDRLQ